jgi:NAD(P)H-quinone oxidoreductase subunit 5
MHWSGDSRLIGLNGVGLSIRLDAVSVIMFVLVSFIGWVVVRYAATYLDGEARQGAFIGWLCMTLASVLVLVLSGNLVQLVLAWVATSLSLHRLLLFYPDRVAARRAAAKKFVTARLGDAALIVAAVLLTLAYSTTDIAQILSAARTGNGAGLAIAAAGFLAASALLKSAQFPMHGWLTEVMETPTPVSALLHAGVINAGGFLLVRRRMI